MSGICKNGMISTPQPEAAEAGYEILQAGGNAVDAAIATAFVQSVVDPLMCGIAGFGSMTVYKPSAAVHEYIDFHAPAPSAATDDMWADRIEGETRDGYGFILKDRVNDIGYQSICVPAALRAYETAHRRHGSLAWSDLVARAVEWARAGWPVRPHVHEFWSDPGQMGRVANSDRIAYTPAARALYCRNDGSPKRVGDWVQNPELADTLSMIAERGAEVFYTGDIAGAIVNDMRANDGLLSAEDLANYEPVITAPLNSRYRGFTVSTNQPPGGGLMLAQMLNVLENFDLKKLGHNSAEYIRVVAETMKYATIDKDAHIGDPAFADVPLDRLLSKEYAAGLADLIKRGEKADVPRFHPAGQCSNTTQISIVDQDGCCVSMTHSLGMSSGVMTDGLGFMYNGCMSVFDPRPGNPGSIAPGKARFSSICPSIVFANDNPYMVIGAPGATQIAMGVLQATLNVLDFGCRMQEALWLPRFSATSNAIDVLNRIPRYVTRELAKQGYEIIRDPRAFGIGWVHGVRITENGLEGGADPGTDGIALSL